MSPSRSTSEQLETRNAELEAALLQIATAIAPFSSAAAPVKTDQQIGPRGLCPGVQVVLLSRVATIRQMLPDWNVEVQCADNDGIETWWRGNLQLVLPRERT